MRPIRTFDFIVVLKKKSTKAIDVITWLMLGIAVVFFLFSLSSQIVQTKNSLAPKTILLGVWTIGIVLWSFYVFKQNKKGIEIKYRFALLLAAWGWFMHPATLFLCFVYIIAALLEAAIKTAPEYAFDDKEIVFNSFPQKKYKWSDVTNVILKYGMLTIDLNNNKIIQGEVNDEVPNDVEQDFNTFCQQQLAKYKA
jgi:uncharacterized protein with PQ loop repeat